MTLVSFSSATIRQITQTFTKVVMVVTITEIVSRSASLRLSIRDRPSLLPTTTDLSTSSDIKTWTDIAKIAGFTIPFVG